MKENKYQQSPFMTIAVLILFFGAGSLAYTTWGTEITRSMMAVGVMFWGVGVGYFIRDGVVS